MARIRTIKPEFFTSEDIVSLSPMTRLLYIALWCEADREGRMLWKPRTFKMRYFPADDCDIDAMCEELVAAGLVKLYGEGLAYVPKFAAHQHLNPREAASSLPEPDASVTRGRRVSTRAATVSDAQGGREGKGRREDASTTRGCRLPQNWAPSAEDIASAESVGLRNGRASAEADKFRDYWTALPGQKGVKTDWPATWRNWCRKAAEYSSGKPSGAANNDPFAGAA